MRVGMINDNFISVSSNIVYKVAMPVFMFLAISGADMRQALDVQLMAFYSTALVASVVLSAIIAHVWLPTDQKAVFSQAVFRGNHGIVALALIYNLYGQEGIGLGSAMVALAAILNNLFSPIVFAIFKEDFVLSPARLFKEIFLNPMMLSVLSAVAFSLSGLSLPAPLVASGKQFASITLPLALMCIGANLSFKSFRTAGGVALHATLGKLVWMPLLCMPVAIYFFDFDSFQTGLLFICFAVPTAAVSFVLAKLTGSDSKLASNIVVMTTFLSLFSISAGLFVLQSMGWM
jgi:predicted permease